MPKDNRPPRARFDTRYWRRCNARARRWLPAEIASAIGKPVGYVYAAIQSGALRASRPRRGLTLIRTAAFLRWIRSQPELMARAPELRKDREERAKLLEGR